MSTGKKRSGELWVLMLARRLGFGRNPLRRRSDRIETAVLWCALVAALLVIPIGAAVGTSYRNAGDASAQRQRASLHEVKARTLESTEGQVPTTPGNVLTRVQISYVDPSGLQRQGATNVVIGTKADAEVPVWLNQAGDVVAAPRSPGDNAAIGSWIGILLVAGSWLLLWGAVRLACVPLDRRRSRDWAEEWLAVAPRWLRGQK
ncbi:hypothetical protein EV651_10951 [Kribbella sp. VKM Ac-2571]|uniref:Rv1733c family protein n=1 Tax=Kribbella sp. VKM Ac-2571 TaxID=2512222 RepID=UPI00105E6A8C|nr:hypothetical protein [Kribbella sp. VKM Ac-2571]TDO58776.1 hypothetical protein EV651_10951 [Kribbella sp. VKM Ac-2571]